MKRLAPVIVLLTATAAIAAGPAAIIITAPQPSKIIATGTNPPAITINRQVSAVANMVTPGLQGPKGLPGVTPVACVDYKDGAESIVPGPSGPAGQIISVTAQTLPPGSPATVQNTGSFSQAELVIGVPEGLKGDPGEGVPPAGTTGQYLHKATSADYDVHWGDLAVDLAEIFEPKNTNIQSHISSTANPHNVTSAQTGAEPYEGLPAADGYCRKSTIAGVRSWGECGTGGGGTPGGTDKQIQYNNAGAFGGATIKFENGALVIY